MPIFDFEDPFDDSLEEITGSLFEQVEILWPDPNNRPDLREGSLMWTLLSPVAFEIQRFQQDLNLSLQLGFIQYSFGEFLDLRGQEFGLPRKTGSQAEGVLRFLGTGGTVVPVNTTASNIVTDIDGESHLFDTTAVATIEDVDDPADVNEIQKISVVGTDRFTLTFDGSTTTPLNATDSGTTIEAAIEALAPTTNFAAIDVTGDSGIANSGGATVVFDNPDVAGLDVPNMTVTPYQVNEEQTFTVTSVGATFNIEFDGVTGATVLDETDTASTLVSELNGLGATTSYTTWSVSTTNAGADPLSGGVTIVFDGGDVEFQDVPALNISTVAGVPTFTVNEDVKGEDSATTGTSDELVKGRRGAPYGPAPSYAPLAANANEIQGIDYVRPSVEIATTQEGVPGTQNQVQQLTFSGPQPYDVVSRGVFNITFDNTGSNPQTTADIPYTADATAIQAALVALPNIDVGDVDVTLVSGGPTVGEPANDPTVINIELIGNLRYTYFPSMVVTWYPHERQSITISGTGTYGITFDGVETVTTLTENSTGTTIANAITAISPTGSYPGGFSVSTETPAVAASSGVTIVFDTGDVARQDVPEVIVTSTTGSITGVVSELNDPFNNDVNGMTGGSASAAVILPTTTPAIIPNPIPGGSNEIQTLEYVDAVPSDGTFDITLRDVSPGVTETMTNIPYNVSGGDLQRALEALTTYGTALPLPSPQPTSTDFIDHLPPSVVVDGVPGTFLGASSASGTSFGITGGPLDTSSLTIEYRGKNRLIDFRPMSITKHFEGVPTGMFGLRFDPGTGFEVTPANIPATSHTQDVEASMIASMPSVGVGDIHVGVATGFQTIAYSGGLPGAGTFDITVDDGTGPITAAGIAFSATAATVQAALEATALISVGDITVVDNGSSMFSGGIYTIYFHNTATKTFKHFTTATAGMGGVSVTVGPTLDVAGQAFSVEFTGALAATPYALMTADEGTLSPEPSSPVLQEFNNGVSGLFPENEIQILSLSHPTGFITLGFGTTAPTTTGLISPLLDDVASLEAKIEELGDIDGVTVTADFLTAGAIANGNVEIEFDGFGVAGADQPLFTIPFNTVSGALINGPLEIQKGHGGAGLVTGSVQYAYSLVTKLGVEEGTNDPDFEDGFGETSMGVASAPIVVANNSIQVTIDPVIRTQDLLAIRKINVWRSLNAGSFKLVGTLDEDDLSFTSLNNTITVSPMYFVDNIDAATFAAITTLGPTANTTGVIDVEAMSQDVGVEQNYGADNIEVLEDSVPGVSAVTNPNPFGGGADEESDDDYRERLLEEAQKDPGAGNVDDYISWAKEIDGVENVAVLPEWQEIYGPLEGPGTVKVIASGENSSILPDTIIDDVRSYIAGTVAIDDPDQDSAPATSLTVGGLVEDGIYEYVYTFINVGKGETAPSAVSRITVGGGSNTVDLSIERGPNGVGPTNTIGRRIYRRKVDGALPGEADSDQFVLVAEVLNNSDQLYTDSAAFLALPTWLGYPDGPYQRRKAPNVNSTSLFDGEAPIGAHVTVESITGETVWLNVTISPNAGYSLDGTGGTINLTSALNTALAAFFAALPAGQDVLIKEVENVLHDHDGVRDFKDAVLFSPATPFGTTSNIPIGPGVTAGYSSAGTFTTWTNYEFDKN